MLKQQPPYCTLADYMLRSVALRLVANMARNPMHRALPRRSGVKPRLTRAMAKARAQTCGERKPAHAILFAARVAAARTAAQAVASGLWICY
jgi:hypothetical protein